MPIPECRDVVRRSGIPSLFGVADTGLGDAFERSWWSNLPLSPKAQAHTESLDVSRRDPLHLTRPLQVSDWTHWVTVK